MRVSRTRFSKRRIKRKTLFPIVAVVQKKRKVESIKSLTFGILKNQAGAPKSPFSSQIHESQNSKEGSFSNKSPIQPLTEDLSESGLSKTKTLNEPYSTTEQKKSKATQKAIPLSSTTKGGYKSKSANGISKKKSRATIDYKNVILLRNLITAEGKILPRRINKLTAKQQRYVQKAIKSARIMGLIPFINKSRPF